MSDDLLITPGSRKMEFKDSSANVDAKIETDASGNLIITNTGGDISIGDTTSDIFVGDGTNNVDIVFEQAGEIRGTTGVTVTLGAADSNIRMATDLNLNSNDITNVGTLTVNNLTVNGTTTSVSSVNTTVTDSLIELNSGLTGANSKDIGFIFERGSTGHNAAFFWDESADRFRFITTTNTGSATTIADNITEGSVQAGSFYGNGANLTSLNASNLGSGTVPSARLSLSVSDIPSLAASKITSGTFADARIPSLAGSKITSGTIATARLPNPIHLSGSNAILKLQETDVTNSPTWWHVADGSNYSIRLNNTGAYPIQILTDSDNDAITNIELNYTVDLGGNKLQFGNEATSYIQNVNKQSTDVFRFQTEDGRIDIGSENSSWAHLTSDRNSFYFNPKITVDGNVEPYTDSTRSLGTSSLRWANVYADTLYGDGSNITGITATDSTKLPLAGGTMTGALNMGSQNITNAGTISSDAITATGGDSYFRHASNIGIRLQTTALGTGSGDGLRVGLNGTHAFVWQFEAMPLAFATSGLERLSIASNGVFDFKTNNLTNTGTISSGAITSSGNLTITGNDKQVKFTGTGGPFGLEFGDDENNPNFRIYYRTSPNTLTFENNGETVKHTFDLSGNYTSVNDITSGASVRVGTTLEMNGGENNSINFEGTGSDTAARKVLYEASGHHYVTNRHTNGDLILMSNNGSAAGETARITLQAGSGTQDIDITNANLDMNSNNINNPGTVDGVDIASRDAVLTSTTTTANAALPKAGGTMTGAINMQGNSINGNNFNINNVNAITINDPGEGIVFTGTNNVSLYAVDDANDNIMKFDGAAKLLVNTNEVYHEGHKPTYSELGTMAYSNLTGTPTIPSNNNQLTNGANYITSSSLSGYATESYVTTQVNNLIDSAPGALNTLNELAAAIGDDASFSTTITNSIATKMPKTGGTFTGNVTFTQAGDAITVQSAAPQIKLNSTASGEDDFWIHVNDNNFYVLVDRDGNGTWDGAHPLQLEGDTNIGYLFGQRIFNEAYHPNADTLTTARTIAGTSFNGSANIDISYNNLTNKPTIPTNNNQLTNGAGYLTTLAFNNVTNKLSGTGEYSTSGYLTAGRGSGGVSLTHNDGYGNANVTFNHKQGVPEQNGNSARIEVNTDTSGDAQMIFGLNSSVTSGTAVSPVDGMIVRQDYVDIRQYLRHMADSDTYIRFTDNRVRIFAGGSSAFDSSNTYLTTAGGTISGTLSVNSGTTNVVSTFQSTDGTAAIKLQDSSGNVELSAAGSTFQVQPSGSSAVYSINSSGNSITTGDARAATVTIGTPDDHAHMRMTNNSGSHFGFDPEHSRHLVITNEQGSTSQAMFLADTGNTANDIWGVTLTEGTGPGGGANTDGTESWSKKLTLHGNGDLYATGNISTPGNLTVGSDNAGDNFIRIGKVSTGTAGLIFTNGGNDKIKFLEDSDEHLRIYTNNTNLGLSILEAGAVQINRPNLSFTTQGTSFDNPGFTYHTNNYLYLRGGTAGMIVSDDSGINTMQIIDGSSGYINFETGDGSSRMRILHTGEVHITSAGSPINPTIKHGNATGDSAKLRLINRSGQGQNKGGLLEMGGVTDDGVSRSDVLATVAGLKSNGTSNNREGYLQFCTNNGSAIAERMTIDSSGNLNQKNNMFLTGNVDRRIKLGDSGVSGVTTSNNAVYVRGNDDHLILNCAGNGHISFTDNGTEGMRLLNGTLSCTADVVAFSSSDERLKDNLKPIENSLEKVAQLKGYEFDWNDNQEIYEGHDVGIIAQEVEKVVPEIVETRKETGYKAVKYEKLVPLLINAINEQQETINKLINRIDTLENGE